MLPFWTEAHINCSITILLHILLKLSIIQKWLTYLNLQLYNAITNEIIQFSSFYFPLAELTPDCIRVQVLSYSTDKDKKFTTKDLIGFYKRVMAVGDARMKQDEFSCGEYLIMDCRGMYSSHVTEMPWMFVQKFTALVQVITTYFLININDYRLCFTGM